MKALAFLSFPVNICFSRSKTFLIFFNRVANESFEESLVAIVVVYGVKVLKNQD